MTTKSFKINQIKYIIAWVIMPLTFGGLIYITSRPKSLLMFKWFNSLNIARITNAIRAEFMHLNYPYWVKYNLPDFLWVFSLTSLLLIIWNKQIRRENIYYIILPLCIGLLTEIGQFAHILTGTFDIFDIIFYILGGIVSVLIVNKSNFNKMKKQVLHLFSVLSIIAFLFIAFGSSEDDSSSAATKKFTAYNYAEGFVKQRLKSPSTAKFPGTFEKEKHIIENGTNEYLINSWVDSQNSYGALIRSKFSCKIIFVGDEVRCENLIIE